MLTVLRLIQSLVRALHSDGTPNHVALGVTLGAALGLTPLLSLHNLLTVTAIALLNVPVGAAVLGLIVFTPLGFLLDPVFESIGDWLLGLGGLQGVWTLLYNLPVVPLSNFNNTIVLGSVVGWLILAAPIYFASRYGVVRYRATLGVRVRNSKWYKAIAASKVVTVVRMVRPE